MVPLKVVTRRARFFSIIKTHSGMEYGMEVSGILRVSGIELLRNEEGINWDEIRSMRHRHAIRVLIKWI